MTLQTSGVISLSDVNVELSLSSTAPISLNDTKVRELAGVLSGLISLSNLYGKSDVQVVTFDNSGGFWGTPQDWNLWNIFVFLGIAVTSQKVRVELVNITIMSSAISIPAFEVGSGWPAGTQLEIVVGSGAMITGKGGLGGASPSQNGSPGQAGGPGLRASTSITSGSIKLTLDGGSVRGGGGGGGGGGDTARTGTSADGYKYSGGSPGGNGAGPGARTLSSGNGGAGGDYGLAGDSGSWGSWGYGGAGGAGGPAIVGSSHMTIVGAVDRVTTFGSILS